MNKTILKGRLVNDPTVKYSGGKETTCFARFILAVEDRSRKVEEKYHVDFIPCIAIGKTGEIVEANFSKGKEILLFGKIQTGSFEKDGKKRYTMEFLVNEIEFCGRKEVSNENDMMEIPTYMDTELPFK